MKKLFSFIFFLAIISCSKDPILYNLTTSTNPAEGGTLLPSSAQFEEGETVVLTQPPLKNTFSLVGRGCLEKTVPQA